MDILDIKILKRLLDNCREPDRQIGKALGISGGAVRARIQKMEDAGIIEEFIVKIEPPTLGYGVLYFVVTGQNISEILEQISLVGEPFFVVPCVGGITVCSIVIRDGLERKIDLAKQLMKDVRVLSIFEGDKSECPSNLTKTDLQIIEKLLNNPREKIETIAKNTNLSTKTVTRCLEKLQENDGSQFTLIYEPTKIQGFIPFVILAWINEDVKNVLSKINEKFSEHYMQKPFVTKNQIVLFMYSDNIFKMDEITQKIQNSKIVRSADLFIPKKITYIQKWLEKDFTIAKKSPTLHLSYQTN